MELLQMLVPEARPRARITKQKERPRFTAGVSILLPRDTLTLAGSEYRELLCKRKYYFVFLIYINKPFLVSAKYIRLTDLYKNNRMMLRTVMMQHFQTRYHKPTKACPNYYSPVLNDYLPQKNYFSRCTKSHCLCRESFYPC